MESSNLHGGPWAGARSPRLGGIGGAPTNSARYRAMGYRALTVQRPPEDPYGNAFADFASEVAAAARDLNPKGSVRPVYVMGHSMGGYTAMRLVAALDKADDVAVMGLMTIDPISPKGCPSRLLSGTITQLNVGCREFPREIDVRIVRDVLDRCGAKAGLFAASRGNWYNYWQGPGPGTDLSVLVERDGAESTDLPTAADNASYSQRLHSAPSPTSGSTFDVRIVFRGVIVDAFKSHGWIASSDAVWDWRPRRVNTGFEKVLVGIARFGYLIRLQALALARGDDVARAWVEPWDPPAE